jgi:5'-nucleotidase
VSLNSYREDGFESAALVFRRLLPRLLQWPDWSVDVSLNINVPALPPEHIRGLKVTRQDIAPLVERFERRVDPRERVYYWLAGINNRQDLDPDTDYGAVQSGYVSITPIHHDLTHYRSLESLLGWEDSGGNG